MSITSPQHRAHRTGSVWPLGPWHHRLDPIEFDVALYAASALFALASGLRSTIPLYREWGQMAFGPYLLATAAAIILVIRSRRRDVNVLRWCLVVVVLTGTVLVPLAVEVSWRASSPGTGNHVQPEVVVVERAASAISGGHDPYQAMVVDGHLTGAARGLPAYESFFPYLPAMTVFGLPSTLSVDHRATDARIYFLLATLLAVALALRLADATSERKLRAFQVVAVLPWAALTLVTGGDDLPIIGLLMLALVLAKRARPGWAGVVLGIAMAMKFTAWPLAALALFAAVDHDAKRRPLRMLAGIVGAAAPLTLWAIVVGPRRFLANVVLFPLGISGVESPAGSALPGHIFVSIVPSMHRIFPVVAAVIGLMVLVVYLRRRPPLGAVAVARLAGWVLFIAILLAPATRVGYLMYPLNLLVWSWMLSEADDAPESAALNGVDHAPSEA